MLPFNCILFDYRHFLIWNAEKDDKHIFLYLYSAVAAHSWVGNKVLKTELYCFKDIILLCSLRQMNSGVLFKIKFTNYICMFLYLCKLNVVVLPKLVTEVVSLLSEEPILFVKSRLVLGNKVSDRTDVRDGIGRSDLIVDRRRSDARSFVAFFRSLKFIRDSLEFWIHDVCF